MTKNEMASVSNICGKQMHTRNYLYVEVLAFKWIAQSLLTVQRVLPILTS